MQTVSISESKAHARPAYSVSKEVVGQDPCDPAIRRTPQRFRSAGTGSIGITVLAIALSCLLMLSCSTQDTTDQMNAEGTNEQAISHPVDSLVVDLTGEDSISVFDLLTASHEVDYQKSAMGVFVTAIDSVENGGGCFWIYSVNDSMAQIGCDKYIISDNDVVKWHFRRAGK